MADERIWLDGELVDWADATVHVSSFGLHYGIGFFEGIRCYKTPDGPELFRLDDHMRRLERSAAIYGISLPYAAEAIAEACKQVVKENGLQSCYLRPIAFLGAGSHPLTAPYHVAIIASQEGPLAGPVKEDGVRAKISSFERFSSNSLPPAAKATGQYLNSFLAQVEVLQTGADEALLLNSSGHVADGWAHNIFIVAEDFVITPPTASGALSGITRDTVTVLGAECGLRVTEKTLVRSDLYTADECFLTGTAAGIVPVVSVDSRRVGSGKPGPVTNKLRSILDAVTCGTVKDHAEWRHYI
jgi:branched-chain amino acid aminotransferase